MDTIERREILDALKDFYTEEEAELWLISEQKLLGGLRPIDCKASESWRLVDQLRSGAYI